MDNHQQMKSDIRKLMDYGMYDEAEQYIKLYDEVHGKDKEIETLSKELLRLHPPKVSLICIDCEDAYIDKTLADIEYGNLEVVTVGSGPQLARDIYEYAVGTDSRYICFLEPGQRLAKDKITRMMEAMESDYTVALMICQRNFWKQSMQVASADECYKDVFKNRFIDGKLLLEYCILNGVNCYGNLTTLMTRKKLVIQQLETVKEMQDYGELMTVFLLYHLLYKACISFVEDELVQTELVELDEEKLLEKTKKFEELLHNFKQERELEVEDYSKEKVLPAYFPRFRSWDKSAVQKLDIEKKMTFFYTDKGEYYNLEPISREAARRGYEIRFTQDTDEKAEIGVYCQHICHPENSKFSMVLLHDMAQGHNRWPDIWNKERWNKFDIGIVPGLRWAERWAECASFYYTQAGCGTYLMGYPKSDCADSKEIADRAQHLRETLQLKYERTVLYAPSWENDEKEDDFIRALASLEINLLIKQASWPERFADIIQNIEQMRKMHEGKYENVYYVEPEESIMVALKLCDLVISEESSVMIEALMYGKPSIAVTDWLIPDTIPKRLPSIPFDYIYKCKKVELREYVENILIKQKGTINCTELKDEYFCNAGHCCEDICDAVDYFTGLAPKEDARFFQHFIKPANMPVCFWN